MRIRARNVPFEDLKWDEIDSRVAKILKVVCGGSIVLGDKKLAGGIVLLSKKAQKKRNENHKNGDMKEMKNQEQCLCMKQRCTNCILLGQLRLRLLIMQSNSITFTIISFCNCLDYDYNYNARQKFEKKLQTQFI